ncbi:hypothetical protein TURU_037205 [Turdus rufiventris]|nr:hypothetical protein TURU_037205 [Turdus rufiventris]
MSELYLTITIKEGIADDTKLGGTVTALEYRPAGHKDLEHLCLLQNGVNGVEEVGNDVEVEELGYHKQNTQVSFQLNLWLWNFRIKVGLKHQSKVNYHEGIKKYFC